ncbi:tRNA (adenosine(37)-N6)-threonylcarbamoyltransferase complex dimerization subunit type 1 TsaB [Fibrobacter succinogenes]|jgi:tRNA threonylcarbamoyladenosine biosynthesis protein TsaB|uniref:tRNA threonylcarbamoyladenosine biosynthesis protein TsaB n=1 Tax=Fibrobacter succinogenes TaxID=833 RepID=A0A380RXG7_FIBSU|nr:tRNA (adenosine(37)-N6)-threonylcarbamoyltransferase complex dimerization subunit type 1 TsaB [Fibrobacter succinogenes]PWJ37335.1 tRNA threonylcarbamoyladenosine biosynthesis protein TsaB [Fibrobacter succinogenes subsp. elongatus]SUQ19582.1 tRNA threonylcarbamoyladenosine biosynthesis protein TsaB [Fibrobacter succinogenes]
MNYDLFVDTSRKGISMALSADSVYEEMVDPSAKGEILSASLDNLLAKVGATLDDVKRVMVTVGPGSFSGLRTGVAFCQGLCFSGKRDLYGVTTLQALACFAGATDESVAVVIRARNGFWYLRLNNEESFIETADVVARLQASSVKNAVVDAAALADEALIAVFKDKGIATVLDTDKKLNMWAPLFDTVKPSLIQEANYIQPSYFEKLKV